MEMIANILLAGAAFGLATYCFILQRRITRFSQLENGMGGEIAVLSAQVDDMTGVLARAQDAARESSHRLEDLTLRAEAASRQLELLVSSLHDLPEAESTTPDADRRMRFVRHRSRREMEMGE